MATIIKNTRDGSLVIRDGTATPLEYAGICVENVSWNCPRPELNPVFCRQNIVGYVQGPDRQGTLTFDVKVAQFTNAANGDIIDVIERTAGTPWENAVNTYAIAGGAPTYDAIFTLEGTDAGDAADHTASFSIYINEYSFAEADDGDVISVTADIVAKLGYTGE